MHGQSPGIDDHHVGNSATWKCNEAAHGGRGDSQMNGNTNGAAEDENLAMNTTEREAGPEGSTAPSIDHVDNPEDSLRTQSPTSPLTGKRANWTIAHKVEGKVITWSVKNAGVLRLELDKVAEANRERAMGHGFVQRVSDAAAMARNSKTGASATPQEKFEAMKRLVDHYASGSKEWSPRREGAGGRGAGKAKVNPQAELLVNALLIAKPEKTREQLEQWVKERSTAQITALLVSEQLKEAVELAREQEREREMRETEGVDAEELLGGLG